jgi:hypothetical protein
VVIYLGLPKWAPLIFIEVTVIDASDFETELHVVGEERFGHRIPVRSRRNRPRHPRSTPRSRERPHPQAKNPRHLMVQS